MSSAREQTADDGGRYLTLTVVAECYAVKVHWVREIYEFGLLGDGHEVEGEPAIATVMLERVAVIRRLQLQAGLNLAGIALLLDEVD